MLRDNQHNPLPGQSNQTITIARRHLTQIITTLITEAGRGNPLDPRTAGAIRNLIAEGAPAGDDDTPITLPAERAYWLLHGSDALSTYGLDETAEDTYEHPAVNAELHTQYALMDQAAELYERLTAVTAAELATTLGHDPGWPHVTQPGTGGPHGGAR